MKNKYKIDQTENSKILDRYKFQYISAWANVTGLNVPRKRQIWSDWEKRNYVLLKRNTSQI